jgi:uncharacterized protein YdhG (YjbR/CyaY superfamily)
MMNFEQYLVSQPDEYQPWIKIIHDMIMESYPSCVFSLLYQIPTYKLNGVFMIHFSVFKHHIGLYPGPQTIEMHHHLLSGYRSSKGAIQIPKIHPIPFKLIKTLIQTNLKDLTA